MTVVHIICPGPTLDVEKAVWRRSDGPTIAVNRAMAVARLVDFWCCIDHPTEVHEPGLEPARKEGVTLLTKRKKVPLWQKELPGNQVVNIYEEIKRCWVWELDMHGTSWSVFAAIGWAVCRLGAKRIEFNGVSLAGEGYFDGFNHRTKDKDGGRGAWLSRWENRGGPGKELRPWIELARVAGERGLELVGLPDKVSEHDR